MAGRAPAAVNGNVSHGAGTLTRRGGRMRTPMITTTTSPHRAGIAAVSLAWSAALFVTPITASRAQDAGERTTNWHGTIGAVAGSLGSYYGSDGRRALGAPLIGLAYKDRLLFGTTTSGGLGGGLEFVLRQGMVGASLGLTGVETRPEDR